MADVQSMTTAPMHCGCGNDNDPWRRFCGGCGAALGAGCGTCGYINRSDDRFCGGCGGVCARSTVGRTRPPGRKPAPAEHKQTIPIDLADLVSETPNG